MCPVWNKDSPRSTVIISLNVDNHSIFRGKAPNLRLVLQLWALHLALCSRGCYMSHWSKVRLDVALSATSKLRGIPFFQNFKCPYCGPSLKKLEYLQWWSITLALVSKVPGSTKGCDEVGQWQAPAQAPYGNKQTHMIFAMGKLINFSTCVFSVGFRTWPTDTDS